MIVRGAFEAFFSWLGALVKRPKPDVFKVTTCRRCGYVKGPRTIAIPRDRCPSCGYYWLE